MTLRKITPQDSTTRPTRFDIQRHVAWRICSDANEAERFLLRQSALRGLLERAAPNSRLLGADLDALIEFADGLDRDIARCVLFGRHPDGFDMSAITEAGEAHMKRTDYNRALWLAITDPNFRESCFGNSRKTLQRYGLELSEDELGKFRWFDSEKLADFSARLDTRIEGLAPVRRSNGCKAPVDDGEGQELYMRAYFEYVRQIEYIRAKGAELAVRESALNPQEFDSGPPPHDFASFMRVLNSWRLHGNDLDRICVETGLLLGRITTILKIARHMGLELPDHPGRVGVSQPDAALFTEAVLRHRPPLNEIHHQSPCSPGAVLDRVAEIASSEWLYGKRVAVLGDDDGISVALAAFTDVGAVTVIDIDPEVIAFLQSLAAEMGVEIDARLHDLREPLPDDLVGRFWLVNADPPQNVVGERFFLEQAFALLEPELGHRVYCSITPFWMGFECYHEVMGFLLGRGFISANIHKAMMAFPVSASNGADSASTNALRFVETALGSLTNMACDIHVLQRAKLL